MLNEKKGQEVMWGVIAIAVAIGILFVGIAGFDRVDANHLGVKVRLGEIKGTMDPGLEWTGVFTNVHQYDMRIRKEKVDMLTEGSSATDEDGQMVFGSVSVNYKLKGGRTNKNTVPQSLYENVGKDKDISNVLNIVPIIKEGFKQATVQYEAIEILQNRQEVKEEAIRNIRTNFPEEYFEIVDIVVEDIDFSKDFKKAIEDKKIATQNKLKEQEKIEVVKAQQAQMIEKYKAEAEKLRLQRNQVSPLLNRQLMLQKWNGKLPDTLIIQEGSSGLFMSLARGNPNGGTNYNASNQNYHSSPYNYSVPEMNESEIMGGE